MRHPCPQCGRKYDLKSWQLGQEVQCPNCQASFILAARPTWTPEDGPAPPQQTVTNSAEPLQLNDLPKSLDRECEEGGRTSSPRESNEGPNWAELDPDLRQREDLALKARIKMAGGKSISQIQSWLEQSGLSPTDAEAILSELTQAEREGRWARRCGGTGLLVGGLISVVVTLVYRPWTVNWVGALSGTAIDPIVAVGFYWCGGLLAFTTILGFLGLLFGAMMDHIRDGRKK